MERNGVAKKPTPICVVRPYSATDRKAVKTLFVDATMDSVGEVFLESLFSLTALEVGFAAFAFGFLAFGLHFYTCLIFVPMSLVAMYCVVWFVHSMKCWNINSDLKNAQTIYRSHEETNFFVAEVYDNVLNDSFVDQFEELKERKRIYEFKNCTIEEAPDQELMSKFKYKTVVGCIAVTRSLKTVGWAWLSRLVVQRTFRRRGIATQLLQTCVSFAKDKEYKGVELSIADRQYQARGLFHSENFEVGLYEETSPLAWQPKYFYSFSFGGERKGEDEEGTNEDLGKKDN